jgi:hypothetical protein
VAALNGPRRAPAAHSSPIVPNSVRARPPDEKGVGIERNELRFATPSTSVRFSGLAGLTAATFAHAAAPACRSMSRPEGSLA